jgi:hypothetical protein
MELWADRAGDRRAFLLAMGAAAMALPAPAAVAHESAYRAPRTRFGAPDLQGIWTNAAYTRLERPPQFKSLVISPQEARKAEAIYAKLGAFTTENPDPLGQKDSEYWDVGEGLARVRGEIRTSWIVDPADGRLPFTEEAKARFGYDKPVSAPKLDNPEDATMTARCVGGESAYPPNLNSPDGNFMQVVQTPGYVVLHIEKYHAARIIPVGGEGRHAPAAVTSWTGDPVGRWQGDTLVIDSTNFCAAGISRYGRLKISAAARVVERLTRVGASDLLYEFQVTDPTLYTQTWRAEMPFRASKGPIYEYSCHEGNYSLPNMLAAARLEDKRTADR